MNALERIGPPRRPAIQRVREREVYSNRFVTVWDDDVQFADGSSGRYLRIVESAGRPGVAALVTRDQRVALVRTFRYATDTWEWGVPRGFADEDDPSLSMRRELAEELGGAPTTLQSIGRVTPNSGLLASTVECFHAEWGSERLAPQDDEVESTAWITVADLDEAIVDGTITDAFTLAICTLARAAGHLP